LIVALPLSTLDFKYCSLSFLVPGKGKEHWAQKTGEEVALINSTQTMKKILFSVHT
jgi:hypothetical protein